MSLETPSEGGDKKKKSRLNTSPLPKRTAQHEPENRLMILITKLVQH